MTLENLYHSALAESKLSMRLRDLPIDVSLPLLSGRIEKTKFRESVLVELNTIICFPANILIFKPGQSCSVLNRVRVVGRYQSVATFLFRTHQLTAETNPTIQQLQSE